MNILTSLNPYMIWIKIAGFALAVLAIVGATHYVDSAIYGKEIAGINLAHEKEKSASIQASLDQLQAFIGKMNVADTNYNNDLAELNLKFDQLKKGLANALRTPLPRDCVPTPDRVRSFHDALNAANSRTDR